MTGFLGVLLILQGIILWGGWIAYGIYKRARNAEQEDQGKIPTADLDPEAGPYPSSFGMFMRYFAAKAGLNIASAFVRVMVGLVEVGVLLLSLWLVFVGLRMIFY